MALSEITGLTNQDMTLIGTGIGAVLATFIATWKGARRKTPIHPTPRRSPEDDLTAEIASLRSELARTATQSAQQADEIERRVSGLRDLLIEIRAKI